MKIFPFGRGSVLLGLGIALAMVIAAIVAIKPWATEIEVYRKSVYSVPATFDPISSLSTTDSVVSNLVYDGLFTIDENLLVEPNLVSHWEIDPTGLVYSFQLRQDVFFHNGDRLSIQDVATSLSRLRENSSPVKETFKRMKKIVVVGPQEIRVELEQPYPPFTALLASPAAKVAKATSGKEPYVLGTGPYQFEQFLKQNEATVLRLKKFEKWHRDPSSAGPRHIELVDLSESDALKQAAAGTVHDTSIYTSKSGLADQQNKLVQTTAPAAVTWVIAFNTSDPLLKNEDLRRCLVTSFDTQEFVSKFLPDQIAGRGFLPPTLLGSSSDTVPARVNLKTCRENFSQTKITLEYPSALDNGESICGFARDKFKAVGIEVQCLSADFNDLLKNITQKKAQMSLLAMTLDLPEVEYFVNTFETGASFNIANYSSFTIDEALRSARAEPDRQKRAQFYQAIDKEIFDKAVTLNLSYPRHISYRHRCLRDFNIGIAGDAYVKYRTLSLSPFCWVKNDFEEKI